MHGAGATDETWARIHRKLAANPDLRRWIEHFLPEVTRGGTKARIATAPPASEGEALEEIEDVQARTNG